MQLYLLDMVTIVKIIGEMMGSTESNECKHKTTCHYNDEPRYKDRNNGQLSRKHQYRWYDKHQKFSFVIFALKSPKI